MAQTQDLRRRIKSVENTRQITKTMEMVATSKLKRARQRVVAARPYAEALAEVLADLHGAELVEQFPLLRQPQSLRRVAVIAITSNRGLCGSFNANLIRETRDRIAELEDAGTAVELHQIGRKGIAYFRFTGRAMASARPDIGDRPTPEQADELVTPLMERFAAGELDAVEVVFARFVSPLSTPATLLPVLPIRPPTRGGKDGRMEGRKQRSNVPSARHSTANYILRPSAKDLLSAILPLYVRNQLFRALVETAASEQGARRTAMKSATDNAGEMIDTLRRTYNRARQAQITQEIAEIVGGAEAQAG
ncbi:MAG: F0F1 ATP synthase subunit gamma [Gemmatimonadetes bacterium]|nr:F0F1 ATP synthase subunit gamma [Gemmatimonadota bacterium]